ncbi:4'-phosphopantetheinyl transferase superfamily protein [Streptomyces sp. NPDC046182]|uniref:4'-phosphopantetheinyl transferase family protein n=1 Tax=Streptomyces sp. NPDC046182 TaxID=3154601 RepID=UPI0033F84336
MIDELLPDSVVGVESYGDDGADRSPLFPGEEAIVARAVEKRRREFTAARSCARRAMVKLGLPPQAVLAGERGAPLWPEGVVGSMTHCDGYRAAVLAPADALASVGIDAEPHAPLPADVLEAVSLPAERERLARLAARQRAVHWERLLFSAKESVYKAWFPLTGKPLGFEDADITVHSAAEGSTQGHFRAELLVPGPVVTGRRIGHFTGRWIVRQGLVATAVTVPHA